MLMFFGLSNSLTCTKPLMGANPHFKKTDYKYPHHQLNMDPAKLRANSLSLRLKLKVKVPRIRENESQSAGLN